VGQPPQREHRPDEVIGVLLRLDPPLLADQFDPLIARHVEPPRHGVDLGVDVGRRHRDLVSPTGLLDDRAIDECLEHRFAVAADTLGDELFAGDLDAIDQRHRRRLRGSLGGSLGGGSGRRGGTGIRLLGSG
jgi:hypothetical protein